MPEKILFAVLFTVISGISASAQTAPERDMRLAGSPVYSDPGFQDFVETSGGYLNQRGKIRQGGDFRDALATAGRSPLKSGILPVPQKAARALPALRPPRGAKAGKYVFVTIAPKTQNYSSLVKELSASAGFVLYGERMSYSKGARKVRIIGWARSGSLSAISRTPGVAGVYLVKKRPAKVAVRKVR